MDDLLDYLLDSLIEARLNVADCLDNDICVNDLEEVRDNLLRSIGIVEGLRESVVSDVRQLKFPVNMIESFDEGDI